MATIRISDEDYEFLKELQHELNTQTNDGNADPVYWGVREYNYELTLEGEGEPRITYDEGAYTLEEAVESVNECIGDYDEETQTEWGGIDKTDADDVAYFMKETLEWDYSDVYWVEEKARITNETGAFITKRACKEYIERYGYNHCRPHTYAMTAYRNFELERLLKILKTMVLTEEKIVNSKKSVDEEMAEVEEKAKAFTDAHKGEDSEKILAEMRGEDPVSEDLEKAARKYAGIPEDSPHDLKYCVQDKKAKYDAVLYGANWQKHRLIRWLSIEAEYLLKEGRVNLAHQYRGENYKEIIAKLKDM